jgi:hypothetical protein
MIVARTFLRWSALIASTAMGLVLLNSAIFRAWVAGGPPNDNPEGWLFSAGNVLVWSLASLLFGIGFFVLLRPRQTISKVAATLIGISLLLAVFPVAREFVAQDACLDSGGQWSKSELRCVHG